jgi:hypothetical protein
MLKLGVSLTVLIVVSNVACAQQGSDPRAQAQQGTAQHRPGGGATEDACRQELRRVCSVGFPPNVALVQRWSDFDGAKHHQPGPKPFTDLNRAY